MSLSFERQVFALAAVGAKEEDGGFAGLALCKNAHWMLDEGLWSVRGDGRVVLAPRRFTENWPEGLRLQPYGGRLLQFAAGVALRPKGEYFARHRSAHGM